MTSSTIIPIPYIFHREIISVFPGNEYFWMAIFTTKPVRVNRMGKYHIGYKRIICHKNNIKVKKFIFFFFTISINCPPGGDIAFPCRSDPIYINTIFYIRTIFWEGSQRQRDPCWAKVGGLRVKSILPWKCPPLFNPALPPGMDRADRPG